MSGPYLVRMNDATFESIPGKVVPRTVRLEAPTFQGPDAIEWIFNGYLDKLFHRNEKLQSLLERFMGRFDDPECWSHLTQGQRNICALGALDGQVKNGGLAQFFWNCPDLILPASEALTALGHAELAAAYDKALEGLIGKRDEWLKLRSTPGNNPDSFWEPFQATYELLDLNWFDDAYFERYGPTLIALLVQYVRSNKPEFIEPSP